MCEFLSISVRKDGAIAHDTSNSHTTGVTNAKWRENTDSRHVYDNFEWDGSGEFDLARICHDGAKPEDLTDAQITSVKRIYGALQKVISGSITGIMPGGILHGIEWWDVYLAALNSNKVSDTDKLTIRKELMTATAGYGGTATAGDWGFVIIEYYDDEKDVWRKKIGEITPDGKLKSGVAYKLNYKHEFEEVK